jgi:hypothetical protein
MITPVFDEIPAYEQAFSPILLFFQHPLDFGSDRSARAGYKFLGCRETVRLRAKEPGSTAELRKSNTQTCKIVT